MVPAGYFLLVIFSNYFTVKRGNLAYFSSFLSLLKSNLKKSLICSTHMGPFWIAILILHTKSFQKIFTFLECLIFCLIQTLAGCVYDVVYCCTTRRSRLSLLCFGEFWTNYVFCGYEFEYTMYSRNYITHHANICVHWIPTLRVRARESWVFYWS